MPRYTPKKISSALNFWLDKESEQDNLLSEGENNLLHIVLKWFTQILTAIMFWKSSSSSK